MKTFKTPKGTELPLLDLRGKDYLQVAHRLVWFREEKPGWSIETEVINETPDSATFRATIKEEGGRIIQVAHGYEDKKDFPDFREKAETKSVGRCLGMLGYGTQFAPEFDEGERLADSPVLRKEPINPFKDKVPPRVFSDQPGPGDGVPAHISVNIPPSMQETPFDFPGALSPEADLRHYCRCGAEMVKSKNKPVLYCKDFKKQGEHSKNIAC